MAATFRGATQIGVSATNPWILSRPTGVVEGDLLVAVLCTSNAATVTNIPSGFELDRKYDMTIDADGDVYVFVKETTASEPTSYSFTFSTTESGGGSLLAYGGVAIPKRASRSSSGVLNNKVLAPSVTPNANSLVLSIFGTDEDYNNFTPPAGWTERADAPGSSAGVMVADKQVLAGAASGDATASHDGVPSEGGIGIQVAFPLAVSGEPPPPPPPPGVTVNIGDVTVTEDPLEAELDLFLSEAVGADVQVSYTTADGTALAGSDYTAKSSARTIPAGSIRPTTKPHVTVLEDTVVEGTEEFFVDIAITSAPPEVSVGKGRGVVTILDDDEAPPPPPPPPPPAAGVMHGFYENGNDTTQGRAIEDDFGKDFACYRYFSSSNKGLPSSAAKSMAQDGRLLLWSVKTDDWGATASGSDDAWIDAVGAELQSWSVPRVVFIFYHEPHDDVNSTTRTATKYRNAWKRIHDRWLAQGKLFKSGGSGKILLGYCGTRSRVITGSPRGSGDDLYPGGSVIDLLCHDSYNEITGACRTFEDSWSDVLEVCENQQKPLVIGEFGSKDGSQFCSSLKTELGGTRDRDEWFRNAAKFIKADPLAKKWLKGFCYFHSRGCDRWQFHPLDGCTNEGRRGWVDAFVNDPHFVGVPFNPLA